MSDKLDDNLLDELLREYNADIEKEKEISEENLKDNENTNKSIGFRKGEQDLKHREELFELLKELLDKSFSFIVILIGAKILLSFISGLILLFFYRDISNVLSIPDNLIIWVVSGVFIENLGVVSIIVKYLWSPYKNLNENKRKR